MDTLRKSSMVRRLRNRYRLLVMNDDTFEEVITFKLTRMSVYILLSTIFVTLVGFTIAVISFTSLKYLIPGYGKQNSLQEFRQLKIRTDSLEQAMTNQQQYLDNLLKVLRGQQFTHDLDTTLLKTQVPEETQE